MCANQTLYTRPPDNQIVKRAPPAIIINFAATAGRKRVSGQGDTEHVRTSAALTGRQTREVVACSAGCWNLSIWRLSITLIIGRAILIKREIVDNRSYASPAIGWLLFFKATDTSARKSIVFCARGGFSPPAEVANTNNSTGLFACLPAPPPLTFACRLFAVCAPQPACFSRLLIVPLAFDLIWSRFPSRSPVWRRNGKISITSGR